MDPHGLYGENFTFLYVDDGRTSQETPIQTTTNCYEDKKNGVFWDVKPCGSCENRRFGGT
jgi:7-cyano-7-deazaguanine synthase in queuosine biosynthesis